MQELVINPVQQELEPLHWVLAWQDVMPLGQLAALLEQAFFPKWLAVLRHWLANAPNYDEVTRWCGALRRSGGARELCGRARRRPASPRPSHPAAPLPCPACRYLGWKSLLPQDLLDQERVRAQVCAALAAAACCAPRERRGDSRRAPVPPP